ncbi:MAG: hypothetical protein RL148_635, partial [Planctomycetota bacterium]
RMSCGSPCSGSAGPGATGRQRHRHRGGARSAVGDRCGWDSHGWGNGEGQNDGHPRQPPCRARTRACDRRLCNRISPGDRIPQLRDQYSRMDTVQPGSPRPSAAASAASDPAPARRPWCASRLAPSASVPGTQGTSTTAAPCPPATSPDATAAPRPGTTWTTAASHGMAEASSSPRVARPAATSGCSAPGSRVNPPLLPKAHAAPAGSSTQTTSAPRCATAAASIDPRGARTKTRKGNRHDAAAAAALTTDPLPSTHASPTGLPMDRSMKCRWPRNQTDPPGCNSSGLMRTSAAWANPGSNRPPIRGVATR